MHKMWGGNRTGTQGKRRRAGLGQRQILRLSSHCSAFTFSNIRHFTLLRMTKWGDARRSLKRRFPSYRQPSPMGKANRWRLRRDPSTQVAAVLAFVISHTTFLAAQDDEMRRGVEIMAMPEGLLIATSRFDFLSSTAGSPMKKISRFARNDDAGAGVSRCISLSVPSH